LASCRAVSLGTGDGHALASPHPDQIGFEFREGGKDVEEQLAHGVSRIMDTGANLQLHAARSQLVAYRPCIKDGTGKAIELGHHQRVALADRRQCLIRDAHDWCR
jgi:hypothetical protein